MHRPSPADVHASTEGVPHSDHQDYTAQRLIDSILSDERLRHLSAEYVPNRHSIVGVLDRLRAILFPGFSGHERVTEESLPQYVRANIAEVREELAREVGGALRYRPSGKSAAYAGADDRDTHAAYRIVDNFLAALPAVRLKLSLDVQAAHDGDPAARHTDEIISGYPGLRALTVHRLAHELYKLDVPLVPRIMAEQAHSETGIDIHPGARIGASFFIDHGTGVVIGETTWIGDHCRLYQGVTLGAKSFPRDEFGRLQRGVKRHPTLEDHVIVYAGATILGGDTVIGAGTVVNGGVFLTTSVPPGHIVRGPKAEVTLRGNPETPPGMYAI